ncbi:hypothetical protein M0R45_008157 [Rubus argutus]|uniref:AB hydrolase-1 domain-containing protein n=1 Tax=Rubus argutus TaxID=59490 RepID=A0AAW1Y3M7_RUBAR
MGNIFAVYKPILHSLMKLAGVRPQTIEIEPGTVMNFWVPTETDPSKKSKPAVVFLHGFAVDGIITWQFQVLSLARNYAIYVPDLLFFGGSITDKTDRSPEFQAECVAKGLRKLGVKRCTLVGLSYTEACNAGLERIGFSRWSDYLLPDSVKGVRNMFEIAAYKFPHLPDWIYKHYLEVMFDNRKEREELLEALVISDGDLTVHKYSQRVYLLWGEKDKIFDIETASKPQENTDDLNCDHRQIGNNAVLDRIENAGHLVEMERPFAYNKQLKKFLASCLKMYTKTSKANMMCFYFYFY